MRYHRENIRVLQLNTVDSEKNIIVYYALQGRNWTFHAECDVSSINRGSTLSHGLKSSFVRLLYIIFFITQIHRVRFACVNGRASKVKPSKNESWKKNFRKKILRKKFWKKMLEKNIFNNLVFMIKYFKHIFGILLS